VTAGVLVAGIGNIFLGDDGFGSEVARCLARAELPAGVLVVDYGIRGMHLAYDLLDGYDALVIVDALPHDAAPGDLVVLEVNADHLGTGELDAHGMDPVAVLANLGVLGGTLPLTYIVGCQPRDLDEHIGLSPPVAAAVDGAVTAVHALVNQQLAAILEGVALAPATSERSTS